MHPFDATSPAELCDKLRNNYVCVPDRGRERTTQHVETSVTCHFLATVARTGLLAYPLRVEPGDKPDLVLSLPTGRIGIEITEAVPEDQARVDVFRVRNDITDPHYVPRYQHIKSSASPADIENIAKGQEPTIPHMGDVIERDWVGAMLFCIQKKTETFGKPDFKKYPENWLLIYDNWSPVAGLNEDIVTAMLDEQIFQDTGTTPFDKIFIQRSLNIWEFNPTPPAVKHLIPNPW